MNRPGKFTLPRIVVVRYVILLFGPMVENAHARAFDTQDQGYIA